MFTQLLPVTEDLGDPADLHRLAPGTSHVRLGMVLTVTGATADGADWTDELGGPADRAMVGHLRRTADAIVVGAGTVRSTRLRPVGARPGSATPRVVIVTNSGNLGARPAVITDAGTRPLVVTSGAAAPRVRDQWRDDCDVLEHGDAVVDLATLPRTLADTHGLARLLCEGGPTLATGLLRAGSVDQLCLTFSPHAGGTRHMGAWLPLTRLELQSLHTADGALFAAYDVPDTVADQAGP